MVMSVNSQRSQDRILTQRNELHRVTSKEKQRRHKLKGLGDKIATEHKKGDGKNRARSESSQKQHGGWRALKIQNQHSRWMLTLVDSVGVCAWVWAFMSDFAFIIHLPTWVELISDYNSPSHRSLPPLSLFPTTTTLQPSKQPLPTSQTINVCVFVCRFPLPSILKFTISLSKPMVFHKN